MRMPQLDGLEACARIREIPRYQEIPIVILTAFDGEVARRKARRIGATAFFVKPFTTEALLRSLAPLIAVGSQVTQRQLAR
jgi:CheY-like chemotaxis protein